MTDPKGYATVFTHDSRDRITTITDPLSQATTYQYNAVGNLSRITNARGYATNFTYDALDRLSGVTDALGQGTTYQYDTVGNRTQMVDRKGQVFTYTYDALNRLTQVQVGTTIFSYTYDAAGNRLTLVDGTGTTAFQYDELDRLTRMTYPDTKTVQYGYDVAGNRTSLVNPGNVTFTYAYDNANRLTGITQGTRTWSFGYDAGGNRTSLTHPNNASITYTYLHNNWLSTITHRRGDGTLIETITYGYDQNGNRTALTDYTGSTVFGYDQLNRLTSAAYPGTYGTWAWTYDPTGNRITQNSPSGQTNYSYDANNRLTSSGNTTYVYDNNGNLTSISTGTSFGYDAHNRMSQANLPGGLIVQYTYNGDGLKIRRIEGSAVTRYYHDGIRPIYETDSVGSLRSQLERDIFGNLLARQDSGGARYYYHHDGLGSTVALTNASGQLAAQRTYDAWGNRRTSSGSAPGNYQFAGTELDSTSGLYHMGARFYDPTIGRWLTEDPVNSGLSGLNAYAYAAGNPLTYIDSSGLQPECATATCDPRNEAAYAAFLAFGGNITAAAAAYGAWLGADQAGRAPPPGWEKYAPLALSASQQTGVPAGLILAIMAQETGGVLYNPSAVGGAGEIGLMQILPSTARKYGVTRAELFDPATNILTGARYLRDLLSMYEGRQDQLVMAVSAYNQGPGNLAKRGLGANRSYWSRVLAYFEWFRTRFP